MLSAVTDVCGIQFSFIYSVPILLESELPTYEINLIHFVLVEVQTDTINRQEICFRGKAVAQW